MSRIAKEVPSSSRPMWEEIESLARASAQTFLQRLLDQEIEELLGRAKSERREPDAPVIPLLP